VGECPVAEERREPLMKVLSVCRAVNRARPCQKDAVSSQVSKVVEKGLREGSPLYDRVR
jgi:hypothetical protein